MASINEYYRDFKKQSKWTKISFYISLFAILLSLVLAFYSPELINWRLGHLLRAELNTNRLSEDGKSIIELTNQGGYPLHDITGDLSFSCYDGNSTFLFKDGNLEGYVDTLDVGPTKALFLDNDDLGRWINNSKSNCSDLSAQVSYFNDVDDVITEMSKAFVYEYSQDNDRLKEIELQPNQQYISNLCTRCNVTISIQSREKNFTHSQNFIFSGFSAHYKFFDKPVEKSKKLPDFISLVYPNCYVNEEVPCLFFMCYEINSRFNHSLNCDSLLEIDVPTDLGDNKFRFESG